MVQKLRQTDSVSILLWKFDILFSLRSLCLVSLHFLSHSSFLVHIFRRYLIAVFLFFDKISKNSLEIRSNNLLFGFVQIWKQASGKWVEN